MANIRKLKKEIDKCVYELISDCLTYSALNFEKDPADITALISEAILLRNTVFRKINTPVAKSEGITQKKHFQDIRKEFIVGIDELFGRLSSLSKTKNK